VDRKRQEVVEHHLAKLIKIPHPQIPPFDFYSFIWLHYNLVGNAFIQKIKFNNKTLELFPILPDKIAPMPSEQPGELLAGYEVKTGQKVLRLEAQDVIHLKKVNPTNLLTGLPTLKATGTAVDIAKEQDKWNYHGLHNRFVSDTIIKLKDGVQQSAVTAIEGKFQEKYAGAENAKKLFFMTGIEGVFKLGASSYQDVDFITGKRLAIQDIATAFGVPLPLLGLLENATYSNFETAERIFWEQTVIPILDNLVSTLNWSFRNELADGQQIIYDVKNIKVLQRDYSQRVKDTVLLTSTGVSMEECNRVLELGLDLKDYKVKPPNTPSGQTGKRNIQVRDLNLEWQWRKTDKKREYWANRMSALFKQAFNAEQSKIIDVIESEDLDAVLPVIDQQLLEWDDAFIVTYRKVIDSFVAEFVKDQEDFESLLNEYTNKFIRDQVGRKIAFVKQATKREVAKIIEESKKQAYSVAEVQGILSDEKKFRELLSGTVRTQIGDKYEYFKASRALTIARTEVGAASGYGQMTGGVLSGFEKKIWITSKDLEVRLSHSTLDGQEVGILDAFSNGLMHPADPNGPASEVINCRCSMTFS